ncbi:hypothetical protein K8I28_11710 [bacterium]|nr:hypothetical protein [bacterium]
MMTLLVVIIVLAVLFWYIRRQGVKTAQKGARKSWEIRRRAFERSVPPEEE